MKNLPKNCWRVIVDQGNTHWQHQVYQQASALNLLDIWIRRTLENGPVPATISLYWYDDAGREHLLAEARLPARMST